MNDAQLTAIVAAIFAASDGIRSGLGVQPFGAFEDVEAYTNLAGEYVVAARRQFTDPEDGR